MLNYYTMAKLIVEVPDQLHKKLKMDALKADKTLKEWVNEKLKD